MRLAKFTIFLLMFHLGSEASAQTGMQSAVPTAEAQKQPINQKDAKGKRFGLWVSTQGSRMGEPGFTEFGSYDQDMKYGPWYKMDGNGELIAIETFRNDILDGEAKYFEEGRLIAVGRYRGLNPTQALDTFMVEDPITGRQSLRTVSTEKGTVRHGMWRFYDARTGRLIREEEYQIDELIYNKQFPMTNDDSLYYKKREMAMPHSKKENFYKPPSNRQMKAFGY